LEENVLREERLFACGGEKRESMFSLEKGKPACPTRAEGKKDMDMG